MNLTQDQKDKIYFISIIQNSIQKEMKKEELVFSKDLTQKEFIHLSLLYDESKKNPDLNMSVNLNTENLKISFSFKYNVFMIEEEIEEFWKLQFAAGEDTAISWGIRFLNLATYKKDYTDSVKEFKSAFESNDFELMKDLLHKAWEIEDSDVLEYIFLKSEDLNTDDDYENYSNIERLIFNKYQSFINANYVNLDPDVQCIIRRQICDWYGNEFCWESFFEYERNQEEAINLVHSFSCEDFLEQVWIRFKEHRDLINSKMLDELSLQLSKNEILNKIKYREERHCPAFYLAALANHSDPEIAAAVKSIRS